MSFSGSASQAQDQRCPCTLKLLRRLWWPNKESIRFESEPSFFCWFVDIFLLNCNMGNFECFFSFLNWKKLGHLGYFWWNMYTSWRLTVSQLFKEGNSVKIVGNHKWIHIIYIYTHTYTHISYYISVYIYISTAQACNKHSPFVSMCFFGWGGCIKHQPTIRIQKKLQSWPIWQAKKKELEIALAAFFAFRT